jgi:hypothetical protein
MQKSSNENNSLKTFDRDDFRSGKAKPDGNQPVKKIKSAGCDLQPANRVVG